MNSNDLFIVLVLYVLLRPLRFQSFGPYSASLWVPNNEVGVSFWGVLTRMFGVFEGLYLGPLYGKRRLGLQASACHKMSALCVVGSRPTS